MADAIRHVRPSTQDDGDESEEKGSAVGEKKVLGVIDVDVDGLFGGHVRQYGRSGLCQREAV